MKPISIYIVEDELLISASLKSQLQFFGYEILGSSTRGEVCLKEVSELSLQGKEPEIILMDIHLRGEMDGIEIARRIEEKFNSAIIFLTGQSSKEVYERSFKIKPYGYLLKPIDMEQTKMTIEIAAYQRNLEIENKVYQNELENLLEKRSKENREILHTYQTVLDNSATGMMLMQDGRIIYSNKKADEILGFETEIKVSVGLSELIARFHPEDAGIILSFHQQPGETIQERRSEIRCITRTGPEKKLWILMKPVLFRDRPAIHFTFQDFS
jgi:DNA-binding NarL/FixJ family response regulator